MVVETNIDRIAAFQLSRNRTESSSLNIFFVSDTLYRSSLKHFDVNRQTKSLKRTVISYHRSESLKRDTSSQSTSDGVKQRDTTNTIDVMDQIISKLPVAGTRR